VVVYKERKLNQSSVFSLVAKEVLSYRLIVGLSAWTDYYRTITGTLKNCGRIITRIFQTMEALLQDYCRHIAELFLDCCRTFAGILQD
jgi:hypothetical protein